MNILQILPELNVGGVETGTLDLARSLVKLGHKAVVVSAGGGLVGELEAAGAIHYQLAAQKKSFVSIIRAVPRLVEIIRKEDIDIVHARSRVPAWIAYFACRRTGRAFITTCHGYYSRHFFSRVMGWGRRVIALSNCIARHMIEDFGVPHERIRLIPRSVELGKFEFVSPEKKRRQEFNVGIVGRITPLKGHLYFIKAMAQVVKAVPQLKIWIVGDAPSTKAAYKEQAEILVKRLGLAHCTEFLGAQADIAAIYAHLDLLVLATVTHEAFGRVIIEAQASGVPVVATEVGGVVDIIENGINGLLVPPADPLRMAEAAVRIARDPQLAAGLAKNGYEKVKEKYNLELMVKSTLDVYREALSSAKALIIKFSSLGDIVLSTAALKAIREKFGSGYRISVLTGEESKDLLLRCPYIDELLVAGFKDKDKGLLGLWRLGRRLRKKNFDLAIDLQNNRKSHILSFLSLAPERYGYGNRKLSFLLNRRVKPDQAPLPPVEHQFRVLKMLGIEWAPAQMKTEIHLELWPGAEDKSYIDDFLSSQWLKPQQKIIGVTLGASSRWLSKNWPLEHLAKLCEALGRRGLRVAVTGTEKDLSACRCLEGMVKNTKLINACAKTSANQLACLIKRCAVFIGADSSPIHIAAAVDTPFVALFGPTDPLRHLPPAKKYVLIKKDLACGPCYKPKCRDQKCMALITPEEVLEAVIKLL